MAENTWIPLAERRPDEGAWVLMYLTKYGGMDRYRAGMYMGPNDWMSAANAVERTGPLLPDSMISHWMILPDPPMGASGTLGGAIADILERKIDDDAQ